MLTLKRAVTSLASLGLALTVTGTAQAGPINIRPFDTNNFGQLGGVFGNIISALNPFADQQPFSQFTAPSGLLKLDFFFENPNAALRGQNEFGIYSVADPTKRLTVFVGDDSPLPVVSRTVQFLGNGSVQLSGNPLSNIGGFGSVFGFYLSNEFGPQFTEDSLNGGNPQAFVYRGLGNLVNLARAANNLPGCEAGGCASDLGFWYVGFEDLPSANSDNNFADMMVRFDGSPVTSAVPEPGTMVLLGTGLLAAARRAVRRRT